MTHTDMTKIAIVGVGKIARDQHLPSITKNPSFELAAVVSRNTTVEGVDSFATLEELFEKRPDVPVVAICTPPQVRFEYAWKALQAGKHVLLEKPPGGTLSEMETLKGLANEKGLTLYATWHSRHAIGVEPAREWLSSRKIDRLRIVWKEDVRR